MSIAFGPTSSAGVSRRRSMTCPVCQTEITRQSVQTHATCGHWRCRLEYLRSRRAARSPAYEENLKRRNRISEQATAQRDATEGAPANSDSYRTVITPANKRPLTPLPRRRKYRFVKRLIRLVDGVWRSHSLRDCGASVNNAPVTPGLSVLNTACANCQGHCCNRGGTRAFLDEKTIARFMNRSHANREDVIRAYVRRLPQQSYRDSCVFHSSSGCSLPRDMRSDTCENFICGGLTELTARIELDGEARFFLAAADEQGVVRTRFVECPRPDRED